VERLSDLIINRINKLDVPEYELNMNGVQNSTLYLQNLLNL
jgi:hypothetical protein